MSSRWLVTGAAGQVGWHAVDRLRAAGHEVVGLTRADLDITDPVAVAAALDAHRPDVVLNTAAWTDVDGAEADPRGAEAVNATGPRLLARGLRERGGRLIQISTDYVFAGEVVPGAAPQPYEVGDAVGPASVYGSTKLAGEQAVLDELPDAVHVVRTSWVYGGPGANFVDTMLRLQRERDTVDVVADQTGSPTWAVALVDALIELGTSDVPPGVLHYADAGAATRADLARECFALVGADPSRVRDAATADLPARAATRPVYSALSTSSWTDAGLTAPRPWRDVLATALGAR